MCIKVIYHNRYADGTRDITEHVDICRPGGPMCPAPYICEKDRRFGVTKHQLASSPHRGQSPLSLTDRVPAPFYSEHLRPPTPRSGHGSGSERESDLERSFKRRSGVYVNGEKVLDLNRRKHERRAERPVVLEPTYRAPAAPMPPPIPIPIPRIRRSTTMPSGGPFVVDATPPAAEKRPKPIIIENTNRRSKHESKSNSLESDVLKRHGSRKERDYLEPHPHHRRSSRSPLEMYAADDDFERAERRRRREMRAQRVQEPAPVPAADVYGSSPFGSSWGSSTAADTRVATPVIVNASPAVTEVKKELRWEDQQRAKHNANIKSRPKLGRSATVTEKPTLHGEVKSILKNGQETKDDLDQLYASLRGLGLNDKVAGAQRFPRQEDGLSRELQEEQEYRDRLKNRFSMPSRRFTVEKGGTGKRRTEVFYPEEGRYKWM
ncbi:hypothetical protein UCRPA7_4767 [Phaeoacremonium minimum UCRPA7]|uniref:Uncharacterized protein n=1 Tax=Phaeoacremonium minimum (strain UCR-PA7) TaxID=1286976 RepID=R8BK35_PHAM7|nr:hypothetical protein UCRPA7_4767 [Phaeoacremonium minimum UCRPA7]EON99718.1 hypothetical protein UCRPA7_4767 [Phaeoacremonium minimum UCRPA7]